MTWIWLVPGGVAWVLLTLLLLWLKKAATEELSTRIGTFPVAAVTVAARLLPHDRRDDYRDEWVCDAEQLMSDTDGKPLTRIVAITRFTASLIARARGIRRLVRSGPTPAAGVELIPLPIHIHLRTDVRFSYRTGELVVRTPKIDYRTRLARGKHTRLFLSTKLSRRPFSQPDDLYFFLMQSRLGLELSAHRESGPTLWRIKLPSAE